MVAATGIFDNGNNSNGNGNGNGYLNFSAVEIAKALEFLKLFGPAGRATIASFLVGANQLGWSFHQAEAVLQKEWRDVWQQMPRGQRADWNSRHQVWRQLNRQAIVRINLDLLGQQEILVER